MAPREDEDEWNDVVSSGASTEDGEGYGSALADANPFCGGERVNLDELAETLHGLPIEDMEEEIKEALRKNTGQATVADTLGVLVKVFRIARESALDGYESWEGSIALCDRLTAICDQNFIGVASGGPSLATDLPPSVVASIYCECGRTFAIADQLPQAKDRLEKATNVFAIIPDDGDKFVEQQTATARASLARVLRRLGHMEAAHSQYLLVLKLHATLPPIDDLVELIAEYCEIIVDLGEDALIPTLPALLADLAEEKFGKGSEKHLKVLKDVADACINVSRMGLAAPVLATRARLLRSQCGTATSTNCPSRRQPIAWATAEAEAAEDEAAQALEVAATTMMQEGDLKAAARTWAEALQFREICLGPTSDVVAEMRSSLAALEQAVHAADMDSTGELIASANAIMPQLLEQAENQPTKELEEVEKLKEDEEKRDDGDSEDEHPAKPSAAFVPPPRCRLSDRVHVEGLRPSWAAPRAPQKPSEPALQNAPGKRVVNDGWDD